MGELGPVWLAKGSGTAHVASDGAGPLRLSQLTTVTASEANVLSKR